MQDFPKQEKARLNLELPPRVRENLARLQDETESASIAEVIRRALALFDVVVEHSKDGGDIILRKKDGSEQVLRLV